MGNSSLLKDMEYQLLICDYDGTLVDGTHTISDRVQTAIDKWREKGKLFTFATARSYFMIKDICDRLKTPTPFIARGGAEIVDPTSGEILKSSYISEGSVKAFLEFARENNLTILIEKDNKIYTRYRLRKKFPHITYLDTDEFEMSEIPKIVVYLEDERVEELEQILESSLKKFPELSILKSYLPERKAWDITSLHATKNTAVFELTKLLGIERESTVGVGDGYNDFPLLEATGLKVAMGNANDELKNIADIVVPSQKEDGVAYLIDKLLK